MATDYDDLRPEVKEDQEQSLKALQTASAPGAMSAVLEVEESDEPGAGSPAGAIIAEELVVQVVPPAVDEFTCSSCFLVHHRSQIAREKSGLLFCAECEA